MILGHSILLSGDRDNGLGWALGYGAVNSFFAISGFLVCRSLLERDSLCAPILPPGRSGSILLCWSAVLILCLRHRPLADPAGTFGVSRASRNPALPLAQQPALRGSGGIPPAHDCSPITRFPARSMFPLWTLQYELAMYFLLCLPVSLLARVLPKGQTESLYSPPWCRCPHWSAMWPFFANVASSEPRTGVIANSTRFGAMFFGGAESLPLAPPNQAVSLGSLF